MSALISLPIFLRLQGAVCALVGSGEAVERKRSWLVRAGAEIQCFGTDASAAEVLAGVPRLVIIADSPHAAEISRQAQVRGIPVNVVDQPALCSFTFPSILERGALTVAVSTNGELPVLARLLRARIGALLPESMGDWLRVLGACRREIAVKLPDSQARRRFWDQLLERELRTPGAQDYRELDLDALLAQADTGCGEIAVVGAGPNLVRQLTFEALQTLQAADCLYAATDVAAEIVNLARFDSVKLSGEHSELLEQLVERAAAGERCVYLLSGDPLSHPGVAQQLARWQAAGVSCRLLPGVIDQAAMVFHAE